MKGFFASEKRIILVAHLCFLVLIILPFAIGGQQLEMWVQVLLEGRYSSEMFAATIAFLTLDVFLPVPSSFVCVASVLYLGPVTGFLACFVGLTIGCWLAYGFGFYFRKVLFDRFYEDDDFRKLTFDLSRYGFVTLMLSRGVPVLAELSVMAAGYHRYPIPKFAAATLISNALLAAAYSLLVDSVTDVDSIALFAMVFVAVPVVAICIRWLWVRFESTTV